MIPYPIARVYWAANSDGEIIYVGRTGNFLQRYRSHRKAAKPDGKSPWFDQAVAWTITDELPADLAGVLERLAICTFLPRHNTHGHTDRCKTHRLDREWAEISDDDRDRVTAALETAQPIDVTFVPEVKRRKAPVRQVEPTCEAGHPVNNVNTFYIAKVQFCRLCNLATLREIRREREAAA